MGKTSARAIRLRTLGQSYKKTLIATNVFDFLVKKYENLPPPSSISRRFSLSLQRKKI